MMADILFDVEWGGAQGERYAARSTETLAEIVKHLLLIIQKKGAAVGLWTAYGLFRRTHYGFDPLPSEQTLAQAAVQTGETLYLATLTSPWMHAARAPVAAPSHSFCRIDIAPGCQVDVYETVSLQRLFLLQHLDVALPGTFDRTDVRLRRVSRERHCDLVRTADGWALLPLANRTYLGSATEPLPEGQLVELPAHAVTVRLGLDGWNLRIAILPIPPGEHRRGP